MAMGFESFDLAEKAYRADVERLNRIAHGVWGGNHGYFLKAMAYAWMRADPSNQRILRMAWRAIVTKYGLEASG